MPTLIFVVLITKARQVHNIAPSASLTNSLFIINKDAVGLFSQEDSRMLLQIASLVKLMRSMQESPEALSLVIPSFNFLLTICLNTFSDHRGTSLQMMLEFIEALTKIKMLRALRLLFFADLTLRVQW